MKGHSYDPELFEDTKLDCLVLHIDAPGFHELIAICDCGNQLARFTGSDLERLVGSLERSIGSKADCLHCCDESQGLKPVERHAYRYRTGRTGRVSNQRNVVKSASGG